MIYYIINIGKGCRINKYRPTKYLKYFIHKLIYKYIYLNMYV